MSSKKRQAKLYQFDPMIYPRFLWVVTGGGYSDIKKWFQTYSGEEIEGPMSALWVECPFL